MLYRLFFENPGPLFATIFVVSMWLLRRLRPEASSRVRALGAWFGGLAILSFLAVVSINLFRSGLLWHDEANILSIAAAWRNGQAMYPLASSGDFYALFYGPTTYLLYAPFLHGTTQPLLLLRSIVFVVDVLSVALLYVALRTRFSKPESVAVMSVAVAALLPYPDELLGLRGDPWLLFFSCLAAALVMRSSKRWAIPAMVAAGVAMGLAIDLKVTVIPVMCVAIAIVLRRLGWLSALIASGTAVIVAVGIFLVRGISLIGYIRSLQSAGHQGFLRSTLLLNLFVLLLLLVPALNPAARRALSIKRWNGNIDLLFLVSIAVAVCVVTGSKFSAGAWHLWPLVPFLLPAAAWASGTGSTRVAVVERREPNPVEQPQRRGAWTASLPIAGGLTALFFCVQDVRLLRPLMAHDFRIVEAADMAELRGDISVDHGRTLVMGIGSNVNDERTNLRYELQRSGERYIFDENEVVEAQKESLSLPPSLIAQIGSCQDDWLIPHGDAPFSAVGGGLIPGDPDDPMYSEELRSSFQANYRLMRQGTAYDIWSCRAIHTQGR